MAPQSQRAQFMQGLRQLHIGDSSQKILSVLGTPTKDCLDGPITIPPTRLHRVLLYYLVIYEQGLTNAKWDEDVLLSFDRNERLEGVLGEGVEVPDSLQPGTRATGKGAITN
jgi:hypothetical protein